MINYVPGTFGGARNIAVNKTEKVSSSHRANILVG